MEKQKQEEEYSQSCTVACKCGFAFLSVIFNLVFFIMCFGRYGAIDDWSACHYKGSNVTSAYEFMFYMGSYLYALSFLMSLMSLTALCYTGLSLMSACLNGPIAFAQLIYILVLGVVRFKASGAYCAKFILAGESGGVTSLFIMLCILGWTNLCSI